MKLIDGNAIAESIIAEITAEVSQLSGKKPVVAFIRVGEDPASVSYVRKKEKTAERIGIGSRLYLLAEDVNKEELFAQIDALNDDPEVNGILIQAPLPKHIDETETFNRVLPSKDVDGFNTLNIGKLCQEAPRLRGLHTSRYCRTDRAKRHRDRGQARRCARPQPDCGKARSAAHDA